MPATTDSCYLTLIRSILDQNIKIQTRNSHTYRSAGISLLTSGETPLISIRKTAWKSALREWEWFMSGSNDIEDLHESVRHWWQPWADKYGRIRYNYSEQFRRFDGPDGPFDQIATLISGIRQHPYSRRNVITTWNTADMNSKDCPITNCHGTVIQTFVQPQGTLDLVTYQRSVDVICGLPHNWIQYWAFLVWLAHRTGCEVGKLQWIGGDCHIYEEHLAITEELRNLDLAQLAIKTPKLIYKPTDKEFLADDFTLDGEYSPIILTKAEMVV